MSGFGDPADGFGHLPEQMRKPCPPSQVLAIVPQHQPANSENMDIGFKRVRQAHKFSTELGDLLS